MMLTDEQLEEDYGFVKSGRYWYSLEYLEITPFDDDRPVYLSDGIYLFPNGHYGDEDDAFDPKKIKEYGPMTKKQLLDEIKKYDEEGDTL